MRIAAQISGEPRMYNTFEAQLANLKSDIEIDWFFYFWSNNGRGELGHIPEELANSTSETARVYLESRMPAGHRLAGVLCEPHPATSPVHSWKKSHAVWPPVDRVFLQYYAVDKVNQLRLAHEANTQPYDVVIRTRADITIGIPEDFTISKTINLADYYDVLKDTPNTVITPSNNRHGFGEYITNDAFAIGTSNSINIYTNLVNCIPNICERDDTVIMPEGLLACQLTTNNVQNLVGEFSTRIHRGNI